MPASPARIMRHINVCVKLENPEMRKSQRGSWLFQEKVFRFLWGVAKNYIMYWGVYANYSTINLIRSVHKHAQISKLFLCTLSVSVTDSPPHRFVLTPAAPSLTSLSSLSPAHLPAPRPGSQTVPQTPPDRSFPSRSAVRCSCQGRRDVQE